MISVHQMIQLNAKEGGGGGKSKMETIHVSPLVIGKIKRTLPWL